MIHWEVIRDTAIGISGFAGGCFTIWRMFIKKWIDRSKARKKAELQKEQEELWKKFENAMKLELEKQNVIIREIKGKLFPNGGTSIDDKLEQALKQLVEVRAGQRNTWEIMEIAVWKSDDQGKFVYVNRPYCELTRSQFYDLLGDSWLGKVADFDRKRVREEWHESITQASTFDLCFCFEIADGVFQKVNGIAIHNKHKETGKLLSSLGRLIPIGEATNDILKVHSNNNQHESGK